MLPLSVSLSVKSISTTQVSVPTTYYSVFAKDQQISREDAEDSFWASRGLLLFETQTVL